MNWFTLEDLNFTLDLTENADINEENIKLLNVILMKSVISQENLRCPKYERNLIKSFLRWKQCNNLHDISNI